MTKNRASQILDILRKEFELPEWREKDRNPFKTLIFTVISQNTHSRNTSRAFENLSKKFKIDPEGLSKADVVEIEDALRVAGLYRNKARVIKRLSEIIVKDLGGSINFIFEKPLEQARKALLELPGVGPKTADVVLLFSARKPTLPIDTHINRISKRLALVNVEADYESIRKKLQLLFDPRDYFRVHVLLIALGRRYCRARQPLCKQCPVTQLCPSKQV